MNRSNDRATLGANQSQESQQNAMLLSRRELGPAALSALVMPQLLGSARAQEEKEKKAPPQEIKVTSWVVSQSFAEDGRLTNKIYGKPHVLTIGNAMNLIIESVRVFREAHGGEFPDGHKIVLTSYLTDREADRAELLPSRIPQKATAASIKAFCSKDEGGYDAIRMLRIPFLAVRDTRRADGQIDFKFTDWQITPKGERVQSHIRLSLEKIKP